MKLRIMNTYNKYFGRISFLTSFNSACILLFMFCTVSCSDGILGGRDKDVFYMMSDSTQIKAEKLELSDGRSFYAVRIDSVNYQQAFALQKDGWVLPRVLGVNAIDEHRHTSMPTIEAIFNYPKFDLDKDIPQGANMTYNKTNEDILLKMKTVKPNGFWTATRFWKKDAPANYVLRYDATTGRHNFDLSEYNENLSCFLLKDSKLIENDISEDEYMVNDTLVLKGAPYTGVDGYDYYVLQIEDRPYTWYEAQKMEKDGWLLPRTEGTAYLDYHDRAKWGTFKHRTLHTDGVEPTIEGLCGLHPLYDSKGLDKTFCKLFPAISWLGTPVNLGSSFMTGHHYEDMSANPASVIEKEKNAKIGRFTLVKRLQPEQDSIQYVRKSDGRIIQPMTLRGMSGKTYYVVDPSGWLNLLYPPEQIGFFEGNGWHVMTTDEFADMMGISEIIQRNHEIAYRDFPLFHTLLPTRREYCMRDADDDLISYMVTIPSAYKQSRFFFCPCDNYYGYGVRLVYSSESEIGITGEMYYDYKMYGLNGNVRRVETKNYDVCYYSDSYQATTSIDNTHRELAFNKRGQILTDEYGNFYKYKSDGEFETGNHSYTSLKRNGSKQIVQYADAKPDTDDAEGVSFSFKYTNDGKLSEMDYSSWVEAFQVYFLYDADGNLISEITTGTSEGEEGGYKIEKKYEYTGFDDNGNWTERVVKERNVEEGEDDYYTESETIYMEKRKISYF